MIPNQTNKSLVRILIVDDHPIVREGLTSLLSKETDFEICGEAEDLQGALKVVDEKRPHIVIVDLSLKQGSGLDLIRRIAAVDRSIRMIACTLYEEAIYAERVFSAGALGYVNKHEAAPMIVTAIRRILAGHPYVSSRMSEVLMRRLVARGAGGQGIDSFSERELQVFELIGNGLTTVEIARRLILGVKTVETHRRRIKEKLGIDTSAQLARAAAHWSLERN